jgi:hypothetical protein
MSEKLVIITRYKTINIEHLEVELNPRCSYMYVKCFQTIFRSGQRRTDSKLRFRLQEV